jgi:hypothetical protein
MLEILVVVLLISMFVENRLYVQKWNQLRKEGVYRD